MIAIVYLTAQISLINMITRIALTALLALISKTFPIALIVNGTWRRYQGDLVWILRGS